jgi:hypothetical protein
MNSFRKVTNALEDSRDRIFQALEENPGQTLDWERELIADVVEVLEGLVRNRDKRENN